MKLEVAASPVSMHVRTKDNDMFADLKTGDRICILHDGIAETYPGTTGVYLCIKLGEGEEIPEEMLNSLRELGWF